PRPPSPASALHAAVALTNPPPPAISPLSLHDALPISLNPGASSTECLRAANRASSSGPWPSGISMALILITDMDTLLSVTSSKLDRKSTRLNSSHVSTAYAVYCLKKTIHLASPRTLVG